MEASTLVSSFITVACVSSILSDMAPKVIERVSGVQEWHAGKSAEITAAQAESVSLYEDDIGGSLSEAIFLGLIELDAESPYRDAYEDFRFDARDRDTTFALEYEGAEINTLSSTFEFVISAEGLEDCNVLVKSSHLSFSDTTTMGAGCFTPEGSS